MTKSSIIRQVIEYESSVERLIRTGGDSYSINNERNRVKQALIYIKEISNKYSSNEMMIRNYFDD